ncbi:MAG: adenylate/guanylate cyclase domain-containing protein [Desulfobacterales bacterium]|nr:adenylate/guanylate cyclase domain-containing protein [Desulfobacterales bacterium]
MGAERTKRKLTAILSADVKGYSRLMEDDEEATVRTITAYREVMTNLIQGHHGRVVDAKGDNILAELASVVDAVRCGVEIQKELKVKNDELPEKRRMEFRIGINLGDVIQDGDTIYGDGVNIAARLEGLADGGGICISGTAFDQVEGKTGLEFEYIGEQAVKNIKKPVRVYLVKTEGGVPDVAENREFSLPATPSIAVLPFTNMSGDPEQEYFSDGITEEIITWLSKIPRLFVTARHSTFIFKDKVVSIREVGQQLGVRYVLEGSVRKSGDRIRVTAQLIDVKTDQHLWADRYDRELKDVFAIQDEITMNIIIALQVKLTEGEQAALRVRGTYNLDAYLKMLLAVEYFRQFSKEGNILARQKWEEAIALAPDYASAYAGLAGTYLQEAWLGWSCSPPHSLKLAMEYAQKCVALDESFSEAHAVLGAIYLVMRQWDKAVEESELAVSLNPNSADNIVILSMVFRSVGRVEEALALLNKAVRLNPMPPNYYIHEFGSCYRLMGRYEEAITMLKRVLDNNPNYLFSRLNLIATYVMSGEEETAHTEAMQVLEQCPDFSVERLLRDFPYKDQKIIDSLRECWLKAGLK